MENNEISLAKTIESWSGNKDSKNVKSITLCVTEACNLACKYCYMTGKNNKKKMSFEIAKNAIDYILSNRDEFNEDSVVWDFIGGEPFLEIDLIDKICDYIKMQMFTLNHPWFDSYRFSFSSNGLLYATDKVQQFISKNKAHLSVGISVDGNKVKHDLQRIYPNGKGSYDDVMENVTLWQEQFKNSYTKATFSHDDLPHLKNSVVSLWNKGIKKVAANVVFENVWQEGDDEILEQQLDELGEYILENKLWEDYYVRFFEPSIGNPLDEVSLKHNYCGAGKMLAIDCDGNFFPCIRFVDFSLEKRKGRCIGNSVDGINEDRLRAFHSLSLENQSPKECLNCDIASGCGVCTGFNYDDSGTIFDRAIYTCKSHKATVRANKKFWSKYEKITGNLSPRRMYEKVENKKYMQIMLSDNITPHCSYRNWNNTNNVLSKDLINKALDFASVNEFEVVFLGDKSKNLISNSENYMSLVDVNHASEDSNLIVIYDNNVDKINKNTDTCVILINEKNIEKTTEFIKKVAAFNKRMNITLENIEKWSTDNVEKYKQQLNNLVDFIEETYEKNDPIEINILTDRIYLEKHSDCTAGTQTFTLAPNGRFYVCPAFYFDNPEESIGSLEQNIMNEYESLMKIENAPICKNCDAYQCKSCKYLNKKLTQEYNTPSKIQCLISHHERNMSRELQQRLLNKKLISHENIIEEIQYLDPLEKLLKEK